MMSFGVRAAVLLVGALLLVEPTPGVAATSEEGGCNLCRTTCPKDIVSFCRSYGCTGTGGQCFDDCKDVNGQWHETKVKCNV